MKLVMIAGPNDPEVIDTESAEGRNSVADAMREVGWEDTVFYIRTVAGDLEKLDRVRVEQVSSDDQFRYMRVAYQWLPQADDTLRVVVAFDWDQGRQDPW